MVVSLFFKFIQAEVFGSRGISHLQCSLKGYRKKKKNIYRGQKEEGKGLMTKQMW